MSIGGVSVVLPNMTTEQVEEFIKFVESIDKSAYHDEDIEAIINEEVASFFTGQKKDFMFIVTDDNKVSYAFSFEERPEGLDKIVVGDTVIVTYTGTISEVDPFMGEILSVEKK